MSKNIKNIKNIKITVLGGLAVGKTQIVNVFTGINFNAYDHPGMDNIITYIKMRDGKTIKLIIFDTAGVERFHSLSINTVKYVQGVILIFDLTYMKSFKNIKNWLKEIKDINKTIPIILLGNKCDLDNKREVSKEEAEQFAKENNLKYFETSAKNNINIKEGFEEIANKIYDTNIINEDIIKEEDNSIKQKEENINQISLNNNIQNQNKQNIINYYKYPFKNFKNLNKYYKY